MNSTPESSDSTAAPVEPVSPSSFEAFSLSENIMKAMNEMGFQSPTPIQEQALPLLLGDSHDFIGLASTGTGKTAAFGIPLIERIDETSKHTQALVLSPTRELALQVSDQLEKLGKYKGIRVVTIYGGASYTTQISGVKRGAHIIVATPGRLVDFLEQKIVKLQNVQTVVLDEADEMISMGFKEDLETILTATHPEGTESAARASCKTWLFSATMSKEVRRVADTYLEHPKTVQINKSGGLSDTVEQVYYTVKNSHKTEVIARLLQMHPNFYGLIFCQTKMEVVELSDALNRRGFSAESLHGDRSQKEREVTLKKLRTRQVQAVVATDVAARGLDIKDLTHVINYNLPWDTESYVHRIGRTGRNGQKGVAISLINPEQLRSLKRIQMQTRVNMVKGKVPTADDVAEMKVKEVFAKLLAVDPAGAPFMLAQSYVEDLLEGEIENVSKEDLLARLIAAYYPQVLVKNDLQLDFVGDRIPHELMPSQGKSRPPIGARSRPYEREGSSREGGEGRRYGPRRFEGRGERSNEGRYESRGDKGYEHRGESRRRDEGSAGEGRFERRGEGRRREENFGEASREGGEGRRYGPRRFEGRGERRDERRDEAPRSFEAKRARPFFKGKKRDDEKPSRGGPGGFARRDDAKGVKRHRSSDRKRM